jgi:site-specific DNA recombinase
MFGKARKERIYYVCRPQPNNIGKMAERFPDHPGSVWVREDPLLAAVAEFFSKRLLGPDRMMLMAADLAGIDQQAATDHSAELEAVRGALDEISRRQDRLIHTLETQDDPTGAVFARVQDRIRFLEAERRTKLQTLAVLEATNDLKESQVDLLEELPLLDIDLLNVPDDILRRLFEAFRLVIRYDRPEHHAVVQATIADGTADHLDSTVVPLVHRQYHEPEAPEPRPMVPIWVVPPTGFEPVLPP